MPAQRILVVDDNPVICRGLANFLRGLKFDVDYATEELEGSEMIHERDYDVLILDYQMPGMTGFDLLKKAQDRTAKFVFFLVNGRPFFEKMFGDKHLAELVDGVIGEPFGMEIFLKKIMSSNRAAGAAGGESVER